MDIRTILQKHGFSFKKQFGQNFITDTNLLDSIAELSGIDENSTVLEIGCGAGTLTRALAKRAKRVIAYEIDAKLQPVLAETLAGLDNVEVVFRDFAREDMAKLEEELPPYAVVANLPYYITTPLVTKFLDGANKVLSLTVMVQDDVARRFCAQPGTADYGAITAAIARRADAKIVKLVPRRMFYPVPNVDSAVVRIDRNKRFDADGELFRKVVKSAFAMRRKILSTCLASGLGIGKEKAAALIEMSGHSPSVRGETLSAEDFAMLTNVIKNNM